MLLSSLSEFLSAQYTLITYYSVSVLFAFSASSLRRCWLGSRKGIRPVKKTERWGAGMSLERGAGLHMAQLMPLSLTDSCFSKMQIYFTFLVPAHLGSPGQGPLNGCMLNDLNNFQDL